MGRLFSSAQGEETSNRMQNEMDGREEGRDGWCEVRDNLLHWTTQLSLRSRAERTEHCQQLVVEILWTPGCVSSRL